MVVVNYINGTDVDEDLRITPVKGKHRWLIKFSAITIDDTRIEQEMIAPARVNKQHPTCYLSEVTEIAKDLMLNLTEEPVKKVGFTVTMLR